MKTGNVILAIFLWLMIPASFWVGGLAGFLGGGFEGGVICGLGLPAGLFFLGLIVLFLGREKKTPYPSVTQVVKHEYKSDSHEIKVDRYCPDCGRAIPFDANICPYCGKKFEKKEDKETAESNNISLNDAIKLKDEEP